MILLFASNTFTGNTYYFDNLDSYQADSGSGGNISPTVSITSPANGTSFTQGSSVSITANAADSDGTVSQVQFFANGSSIGVDNTSPYAINWTIPLGTFNLTAVATDNNSASTTSTVVQVTGQAGGSPTHVLVSSVTTGTASASQGNKYGTAAVTVVNNLGSPVAGATVSGVFSGTFSQSVSGTTNAQGQVSFQTSASAKGAVVVNFCISNVSASPLIYDAAQNSFACPPARLNGFEQDSATPAGISVYPNPAVNRLAWTLNGFSENVALKILDQRGRVVLRFSNQESGLDISRLSPGVYFLEANDGNRVEHVKFMKAN